MALGITDISTIDVHACGGFERDIVDSVYAAVAENGHVPFLVDSLTDLLNLCYFGVGAVVYSTEQRLSFLTFVDPDQGPGQVVMYRGSLAGVPDPADDRICFVVRHLEEIHREPVLARSERFGRDGTWRAYQFL